MAIKRPLVMGTAGSEIEPGVTELLALQAMQDGDTIDPDVLPDDIGGGPATPGTTTVGNVPTYGDTAGDSLDAGFPVSTAAKTVLDDASVSAMVDTLGGASATGSGGLVRATSPALTTPNLGTPSAVVLTNATGLSTAGIVDDAVTNAKLANAAAHSFKANLTGSAANPTDVAVADLTEEAAPASGDFVLAMLDTGELRKIDIDNLPGGTPADGSITNAKLANAPANSIKGNASGSSATPSDLVLASFATESVPSAGDSVLLFLADGTLALADVDDLPPGDTSGLQATSEKGEPDGYAELDSLGMVPTAQQRPRQWDKRAFRITWSSSIKSFVLEGANFSWMSNGEQTDAPGNGGQWVLLDAASGGHAGILTAYNITQTRFNTEVVFRIKTGASLSGHRFWFGLFASFIDDTAPVADGGTFSIASAAFTWDATVHSGSNFWRMHTSDGSGASGAKVTAPNTSATAIAVGTEYDLRIKCTPATPKVEFFINDVLVATNTTKLPSASATLGVHPRWVGTNATCLLNAMEVTHD